jgi:hypothetical protein
MALLKIHVLVLVAALFVVVGVLVAVTVYAPGSCEGCHMPTFATPTATYR